MGVDKELKKIQRLEQVLAVKKIQEIEKGLKSNNPSDVISANEVLNNLMKKDNASSKSFLIDPLDFNSSLGYKDKPYSLSYTTLKRMSVTPIINAIIKTRKNQIADFAEPQADRYSTGFIIRKKPILGVVQKMTPEDNKVAYEITNFLLNGGKYNSWCNDDFDTFIRKLVNDSLIYDQMTFECIRNRRGELIKFQAVDGATFRIAESFFDNETNSSNPFFGGKGMPNQYNLKSKPINGYLPSYVQIYQNAVVNEFYPWELCFGLRNPSTSIYANGYGVSELEELINTVTSMLWGDEYNRRFFSQGSAPKGLLRIKDSINETSLKQFKQQWQSMLTGVMQSWKTPVIEADVEWIDLQKNNRDMEYTAWMEYLIKIACSIYSIDPSEIGWDISRSHGNSGLFEGGTKERLQNSKDKGLYPLLKFLQRKINRYIIEQINPDFEFVFIGLNGLTIAEELDMDVKKLGAFQTVNEIREKWNLKPIKDVGDVIENGIVEQRVSAIRQQQLNASVYGGGGEAANPPEEESEEEGYDEEPEEETDNSNNSKRSIFDRDDENTEKSENNNIFIKAFDNFLKQEENDTQSN